MLLTFPFLWPLVTEVYRPPRFMRRPRAYRDKAAESLVNAPVPTCEHIT